MMKLAFIIPAYNEEPRVGATVAKLKPYSNFIIVANDCSTDRTSEVAKKAGAIVVDHETNKGYDSALNSGFKMARSLGCTHIITFDADGQHPAHQVPQYINGFESGNKMVLGIRPKTQRLSETIFGLYTKIRFKVADPLCGMKGFDLTFLDSNLKDVIEFDTFKSTNTELMLRFLKAHAPFIQLKIDIEDRGESVSRFGSVIKGNYRILKSMVKGIFHV